MATKFLLQDSRYKTTTLKKHLIQHLIISGSSSIADIAKELQLSIPTVTKFVSELMNDNYILDLGKQNTPGGRKPNIYGLNPNAGYFVGVDVEVKKVLLATIDFCGNVIDEGYVVRYNLEDTEEAFDRLCEIVQDYIHQLEIDTSKVLQVGINLGGRVNPKTGFSYSFFHFDDKPLTEKIEKRIGIPVNLENDSRAMMYGEFLAGVVKNEKNILFININWGLGAGIIIDGKPYYGKSGFSGEVGHVCALDNEIICNCGKKGCFDAYCAAGVLSDGYGGSLDAFFTALDRGEEAASSRWDAYLRSLATAVNSLHMAFDCPVILGGYVGAYMVPYMERLRAMASALDTFGGDGSYLQPCLYRREASAVGAALLFIEPFMESI